MNQGPYINFQELVDEYNRLYGTAFKSEKEMYAGLYPYISPAMIASQIGVCADTIRRRLDILGIPRSHAPGGPNRTYSPKRNAFLAIPPERMAGMTFDEICKEAEICNGYCSVLVRRFGREYRPQERPTMEG